MRAYELLDRLVMRWADCVVCVSSAMAARGRRAGIAPDRLLVIRNAIRTEPFDQPDPAYRDRAPKLVIDSDGKERLLVEEQVLGSQQGMGGIGGVGARQGVVSSETMKYEEGRPGGVDPCRSRLPNACSRPRSDDAHPTMRPNPQESRA